MQKAADAADISVLFFQLVLIFEPFWVILGSIWAMLGHFWAILGNFRSFLGHFLVLIFFGQKFISAIFITFCISDGVHLHLLHPVRIDGDGELDQLCCQS